MHFMTSVSTIAIGLAFALSPAPAAANPSEMSEFTSLCPLQTSVACIVDHFDAIYSLAESGNTLAANALYTSLTGCDEANAAPIRGSVKLHTVTPDAPKPKNSQPIDADAEDLAQAQHVLNTIAAGCSYFSASQISKRSNIRWLAASQGNSNALNDLWIGLVAKSHAGHNTIADSDDAKRLVSELNKFADSRHPDVLEILSQVYSQGVLVQPDYVKAYGFAAAAIVVEKQHDVVPEFKFRQLDKLFNHLTKDERIRAQDFAVDLTHTN